MNTEYTLRLETLGAVKSRQAIWTTADQQATEGLADTDMVHTYTRCTPFGNFLIAIEPAKVGN